MTEHVAKRPTLSVEDVLVEMEDKEMEHTTVGSDNEFEDICSLLHFPMKQQNNSSSPVQGHCWFCWHKQQQQRHNTQWYCHEC